MSRSWAEAAKKKDMVEPTYTIHSLLSLLKSKTCRRMRSPHCSVCAHMCVRAWVSFNIVNKLTDSWNLPRTLRRCTVFHFSISYDQ